ncbi:MAG: hypothetical protein ACI841_004207 [Planctomycetota bacterium]|jgi:hypothetical protein
MLAGPVLAGPVLAGPVLAGPVLAAPMLEEHRAGGPQTMAINGVIRMAVIEEYISS